MAKQAQPSKLDQIRALRERAYEQAQAKTRAAMKAERKDSAAKPAKKRRTK